MSRSLEPQFLHLLLLHKFLQVGLLLLLLSCVRALLLVAARPDELVAHLLGQALDWLLDVGLRTRLLHLPHHRWVEASGQN